MITERFKKTLQRLRSDERGVSPVVGFVLMFALVMIVYSMYQSSVVPAQNKKVEYEHSQIVEGQMEQLSAAIVNSAGSDTKTSTTQRTTIQTGVRYPTRAFAINPGNPVGALEATDPQPIVISGIYKINDSGGNESGRNTSFINYQPKYNMRSEETEISLEYSMVLKDYSGSDNIRPVTTDGVFSEQGVNLDLISSDLNKRQMSTPVTAEATGHWNTTALSGGATITLPTTLPRSQWQDLVDKRDYATLESYQDNSPGINRTTISIASGTEIRGNRIVVGNPETNSSDFDVKPYLTNVTSLSPDVFPGGNATLTTKVTDEFGGPLSGIDLETSTNGSGEVVPSSDTSGNNGKNSFVYVPGSNDNGTTVGVTAQLANNESESVTFGLRYPSVEDNGTGDATNREPIKANKLTRGEVNQLEFKITPPSLEISGFSVVTKGDASALNETSYSNQFQITDSKYIDGVSGGYNPLRYASGEPIQFDGQNYVFQSGPRRVVSSRVYLQQWPESDGVTINDFVDSYDEADIVVYFILNDGSRRPVYIDATVPGSSTTTASSAGTTTTVGTTSTAEAATATNTTTTTTTGAGTTTTTTTATTTPAP